MLRDILKQQEKETRTETSVTKMIKTQGIIDPNLSIVEPTAEEKKRKKMVKKILDNF